MPKEDYFKYLPITTTIASVKDEAVFIFFFFFFFLSLLTCGLDHGETPGPPVRGAFSYGPEIGTKKDYGQKGKTKEKELKKSIITLKLVFDP